jgi:transposase
MCLVAGMMHHEVLAIGCLLGLFSSMLGLSVCFKTAKSYSDDMIVCMYVIE